MKNNKHLVGLVDTSHYDKLTDAVEQVLEHIHFSFNKEIRTVAIKLNLHNYWTSSSGETTDPKVVEAIVDVIRMHTSPDEIYLVESDATVMRTKHSFKMLGYMKLAKQKNLKLVNLGKEKLIPLKPDVYAHATNSILQKIQVPEILTKANLFISVPKLKLHSLTGLTCSLKNQFGCIPIKRKVVFHESLNRAIAIINKAVTPDLIIVDGIISKGKTPKRLNLLMAGCDPVAVDFVAAKISGLNPKRIKHLIESKNLGVGSTNVKCVGANWNHFAEIFPRKGFLYNNSRKSLLSLYGLYLRRMTLEGKVFGAKPAAGG
jgi:uncharacterized protein (DUF362 family)